MNGKSTTTPKKGGLNDDTKRDQVCKYNEFK